MLFHREYDDGYARRHAISGDLDVEKAGGGARRVRWCVAAVPTVRYIVNVLFFFFRYTELEGRGHSARIHLGVFTLVSIMIV